MSVLLRVLFPRVLLPGLIGTLVVIAIPAGAHEQIAYVMLLATAAAALATAASLGLITVAAAALRRLRGRADRPVC